MNGSMKLQIDAREALSIQLADKTTGADTLVTGYMLKGNQIEITLHFAESGLLRFKPSDEANYYKSYGFDDAAKRELQIANAQTHDYEKLTISGTEYYVPWLGVLPNNEAEIKLEYTSKNPELDSLIVLEKDKEEIKFLLKDDVWTQEIFINNLFQNIKIKATSAGTYTIKAYAILKGNIRTDIIGQLQIECQDLRPTKIVRIFRVRRSDETAYPQFDNTSKINLIDMLNKYYKQAFIKFELDNMAYSDELTISKSSTEVINNSEREVFNLLPQNQKSLDANTYYIFICTRGGNSPEEKGLSPVVSHFSVLFKPEAASPAHEMGHNLGLQHTFKDKDTDDTRNGACKLLNRSINKHNTYNIMDYSYGDDNRHSFFKYQIDHLKTK
jgi:hypothetical protein